MRRRCIAAPPVSPGTSGAPCPHGGQSGAVFPRRPPTRLVGAHLEGGAWSVESSARDALVRRMVAERLPFTDLTVQPLDLQDIILGLRAEV